MRDALTGRGLAFRPIPSGHDTDPGPRCHACRERVQGPPAWDEHHRAYHPTCLGKLRQKARPPC